MNPVSAGTHKAPAASPRRWHGLAPPPRARPETAPGHPPAGGRRLSGVGPVPAWPSPAGVRRVSSPARGTRWFVPRPGLERYGGGVRSVIVAACDTPTDPCRGRCS
ncbi:MAG: hypothetical protein GEU93_08635 [Propionibacteriales bacterium]|nr:hypothetical protein [Propionibacteriales bacterium]